MSSQRIYWRRDLPPLCAELETEHVIEAESPRVPLHFGARDALWDGCYERLKEVAQGRILQELDRVDGWCAHVADEQVHSKVNESTGEYWLTGRFTYVQYNRPRGDA